MCLCVLCYLDLEVFSSASRSVSSVTWLFIADLKLGALRIIDGILRIAWYPTNPFSKFGWSLGTCEIVIACDSSARWHMCKTGRKDNSVSKNHMLHTMFTCICEWCCNKQIAHDTFFHRTVVRKHPLINNWFIDDFPISLHALFCLFARCFRLNFTEAHIHD